MSKTCKKKVIIKGVKRKCSKVARINGYCIIHIPKKRRVRKDEM